MAYGFRAVTNIKGHFGSKYMQICVQCCLSFRVFCALFSITSLMSKHTSRGTRPATCAATRPPPEPTSATTFRGWSGPKVVNIMFLSSKYCWNTIKDLCFTKSRIYSININQLTSVWGVGSALEVVVLPYLPPSASTNNTRGCFDPLP